LPRKIVSLTHQRKLLNLAVTERTGKERAKTFRYRLFYKFSYVCFFNSINCNLRIMRHRLETLTNEMELHVSENDCTAFGRCEAIGSFHEYSDWRNVESVNFSTQRSLETKPITNKNCKSRKSACNHRKRANKPMPFYGHEIESYNMKSPFVVTDIFAKDLWQILKQEYIYPIRRINLKRNKYGKCQMCTICPSNLRSRTLITRRWHQGVAHPYL